MLSRPGHHAARRLDGLDLAWRRGGAFSHPLCLPEHHPQALLRWPDLLRVLVRVHALGEEHSEALDAQRPKRVRHLLRCLVARLVAVVGDVHPLRPVRLEGRPVVTGEALRPVARRHLPEARHPERHRVDQALAQDDHLARRQRLHVPHPLVRARQVQVHRRALAQLPRDLPSVDLRHPALLVEDRHHQAAVEVLVAARAVHPELLQPPA
jgi:hypothetical protein